MAFLFTQSHFNLINPKSLILLTIFLLLSPLPSYSSDPDPLQDFCIGDLQSKTSPSINGFPCKPSSNVTSNDFFFDGLNHKGNTSTSPFKNAVTPGNVLTFPGLNTLGISMNRLDIAPGGVNPPHSHSRATELGYVIKGRVLVGLITTGNVFYAKNLSAGEMFVVPRGLLHFQMNVGKKNVVILAAFNSQLPGSSSVGASLFGAKPNSVPDDVLTKAFLVEQSVVDEIKSKFGA